MTNGSAVTYWPGPEVLANGFGIGSDSNGLTQARAMFDDLTTWNYPLDAGTISATFEIYSLYYYGNPLNPANLFAAQSYPTNTPVFNAIAGPGSLLLVSSNASGCVSSANVWLTNVAATVASNGTMNLQFTIAGGSNSLPYDVFASTVMGALGSTNIQWAWMGQGYSCNTYLLTNLPNSSVYLILGTPTDHDQDGLTDAYEVLVSHTDPYNWDTDGDGISDSDEVLLHLNPLVPNPAIPPGPLIIPTCPQ